MLTSPDFKELLNLFKKHNVKYLVVDGCAVMLYSDSLGTHSYCKSPF